MPLAAAALVPSGHGRSDGVAPGVTPPVITSNIPLLWQWISG